MSTKFHPDDHTNPTPARAVTVHERSIGEIMGDLTQNFSTLVRQEVALAKAELSESGKRVGKGAGMFGGAGVFGHLALLFLSLAVWWTLAVWIGDHERPALGWAGLIVAVVWAIVAAILAAQGKRELEQVNGIPQTTQTVKQIPDALKGNEENR